MADDLSPDPRAGLLTEQYSGPQTVISGRDVAMPWILLAMVAFGMLVAAVFPLISEQFVIWRPGREPWFRLACLAAGLLVSGFAYAVARFTLYETNKRLAHLAAYDALTGLGSRHHFLRQLGAELNRSDRTSCPVSLLIADIDHFKLVNDEFGHLVGDEVLALVADRLASSVRQFDTACRIGGEEFAVVMPQAGREQALKAAERIRSIVAVPGEEGMPPVTISLGVASFPGDADSMRLLIKRADDAMYEAKAAGRNASRAWATPSVPR